VLKSLNPVQITTEMWHTDNNNSPLSRGTFSPTGFLWDVYGTFFSTMGVLWDVFSAQKR
jgi:hypothetical protein